MKIDNAFKLPNDLIRDPKLNGSARRLAAVLYSHHNGLGVCHKSLKELSALSGMATGTIRQAAKALCERGYVTTRQTYYYSQELRAVVKGRTEYVCDLSFSHGFTFIPRSVLDLELGKAAFSVLLFLYCCKDDEQHRAWPSIKEMREATGAACSTVCEALRELKKLPMLLVRCCRKVNRAFTRSSYIFTRVLAAAKARVQQAAEVVEESVAAPPARAWGRVRTALRKLAVRALEHIPFSLIRGSPIFDTLCLDPDNDKVLMHGRRTT